MAFRSLTLFGVTGIMGTLFINRSVPQVEEDSNGNVRLYNRGFSNLEYKNLDGIYVELPPYHIYINIFVYQLAQNWSNTMKTHTKLSIKIFLDFLELKYYQLFNYQIINNYQNISKTDK